MAEQKMIEMMKAMQEQFTSMKDEVTNEMEQNRTEVNERLQALETGAKDESTEETETSPVNQSITVSELVIPPKEKQLIKQFGSDTSASALLEFLDHYNLCRDMNQQRKVHGWDDPQYRARELRYQLQGEAAVFVRQEETMAQSWVLDDDQIIEKLKERWLNRDCIEMDILEFEEARQGEYETLAQYMQRLKGLGQRAFSEFDAIGMHQRIIWRFLDGVRDREIRSAIIRERWMKDRKTPKSYEEVLKIATNTQMTKVAANATGSGTANQANQNKGRVAALNTPSGAGRGGEDELEGKVSREKRGTPKSVGLLLLSSETCRRMERVQQTQKREPPLDTTQ